VAGAESRAVVLVDVDDVVNTPEFSSAARRHLAFHHGWRRGKTWCDGRELPLFVNPAHGRLLLDLAAATGAELAWATTLEESANLHVAPLLGLPRLAVVTPAPFGEKAAHVVPFTAGRPWVWLDDSAAELAAADRLARASGQPHLGIQVDPATGLTARHAELARAWITGADPREGNGAFADLNTPCGDEKCPWRQPKGGLPAAVKAARRHVPLAAVQPGRSRRQR
jgi:hypothetical protein